ncbi:DUF3093 domain-containing protein [Kocuria sp. KSNUG]|uniref:DUF3093 domain-containing protein n=1 Tax=Kocuria sp. KSNUG TaxID=3136676 RepID=UPI003C2D6CD5
MSSQHPVPGEDTPQDAATSRETHGTAPGSTQDRTATADPRDRDVSPASRAGDVDRARAASSAGAAHDGAVRYREKLTVSWWMWLIVAFVGGTGFVAVAPINITVGIVVAVVLVLAVGLAVHLGAPSIVLTDEDLRVGRAYIERRYVGRAEALRGAEAREARGPQLDGRAFMNFRVSVPDMCRIEITDPVDPTPYWLTATRHPEELARAVNERPAPGHVETR